MGNKSGIKAQHKDVAGVIATCAKYTGTGLVILTHSRESWRSNLRLILNYKNYIYVLICNVTILEGGSLCFSSCK